MARQGGNKNMPHGKTGRGRETHSRTPKGVQQKQTSNPSKGRTTSPRSSGSGWFGKKGR